jgi:hypothetical protein
MTGVLFWNVCGNNVSQSVGRVAAASHRHVRIVVLAEVGNGHNYAAELTAATGQPFYELQIPGCAYIRVFTCLSPNELVVARADRRYAILKLLKPKYSEILLALAHLPPKGPGPNSIDNQRSVALDLWNEIRLQETTTKDAHPFFDHKSLQILDGDGIDNYRSKKKGIPKKKTFSDHLPIVFQLTV